jgi:hypothetical protein
MPAGKGTRTSKLKQLEDYKRRMNRKPMGGPSKLRPKIKGKPKPSLGDLRKPRNPKGTGAPMGGFRKPKFNPKTLSEKGKRVIKSRMTGGNSTGILFPDVYKVKK